MSAAVSSERWTETSVLLFGRLSSLLKQSMASVVLLLCGIYPFRNLLFVPPILRERTHSALFTCFHANTGVCICTFVHVYVCMRLLVCPRMNALPCLQSVCKVFPLLEFTSRSLSASKMTPLPYYCCIPFLTLFFVFCHLASFRYHNSYPPLPLPTSTAQDDYEDQNLLDLTTLFQKRVLHKS